MWYEHVKDNQTVQPQLIPLISYDVGMINKFNALLTHSVNQRIQKLESKGKYFFIIKAIISTLSHFKQGR